MQTAVDRKEDAELGRGPEPLTLAEADDRGDAKELHVARAAEAARPAEALDAAKAAVTAAAGEALADADDGRLREDEADAAGAVEAAPSALEPSDAPRALFCPAAELASQGHDNLGVGTVCTSLGRGGRLRDPTLDPGNLPPVCAAVEGCKLGPAGCSSRFASAPKAASSDSRGEPAARREDPTLL